MIVFFFSLICELKKDLIRNVMGMKETQALSPCKSAHHCILNNKRREFFVLL